MTKIRKNVLNICKIAEMEDSYSYNNTDDIDYNLNDDDEWKAFIKHNIPRALYNLGESYYANNMHTEQETIQFSETMLRDKKVITAIISWVEKNTQTGTIHLQLAYCTRTFGNCY